jgi:hypothetical protein
MTEEAKTKTRRAHWLPGDPLTERDQELLEILVREAEALGYTPTRSEAANFRILKRRFGSWSKAVRAAGLPWVGDAEQHSLRAKARSARRKAPVSFVAPQPDGSIGGSEFDVASQDECHSVPSFYNEGAESRKS